MENFSLASLDIHRIVTRRSHYSLLIINIFKERYIKKYTDSLRNFTSG